ncbi:MAG: hypothetical protein SVK08_01235 [Halobacteriota archaeon]|nr:hypothetical protein [Halobacteriota archaeon]
MNIEEIEITKKQIRESFTRKCKDCELDPETCTVQCITDAEDLSAKLKTVIDELTNEQARAYNRYLRNK